MNWKPPRIVATDRGLLSAVKLFTVTVEPLKLQQARGACTYVAMVCDNQEVQKLLPQIIIGNRRRFTRRLMRSVAPSKPNNVRVWSGKRAAVTR